MKPSIYAAPEVNRRNARALLFAAVLVPFVVQAAIPQVFFEHEKPKNSTVLPTARRPAQDNLEKVEDIALNLKDSIFRLFSNFALQNTLTEGTELALNGKLDESFFQKSSLYQSDVVFFREVFSRLHVRRRGTNVVAKILGNDGPIYFEGAGLTVSVDRKLYNLSPTEIRNGGQQSVFYGVNASFKDARMWRDNQWSAWKPEFSLPEFSLVVYPIIDRRESILNDGKPRIELKSDFTLAPMKSWELPSPPTQETFTLLRRLEQIPPGQRLAGLRKLAEADDAEAQYILGYFLERGRNVAVNTKEAYVWFERSANHSFVPAAFHLAKVHLAGVDVPRNQRRAMTLLTNAMNKGHLPSLALLGSLLAPDESSAGALKSRRPGNSRAEGMEFLEFAAERGERIALYELGMRLLLLNPTNANALTMLHESASRKYPDAAFALGSLSASNSGEAWNWFMYAASWGAGDRTSQIPKLAAKELLALRDKLTEDQMTASLREMFTQSQATKAEETWDP